MFDVSFQELVLIAVVALLVIGPKRLPEALRTLGLWIGRMRRSFNNVRAEIEREIGMDEIRRQLHNEAVMEEMRRIEREVRDSVKASEGQQPADERSHADAGAEPPRVEEAPRVEGAPGVDEAPEAETPPAAEAPPPERSDGVRHG
ncbi:MAG TPA: Sec-independent protein translocase protein TatB [Pseudomonadales bacterium]